MRERPTEAVIFDLGRVLVNYDTKRTCLALADFTHLSAEEIHDAIFTGPGYHTLREPYEVGAFPCETFFEHISRHVHLSGLRFEEFKRRWSDILGPPAGTSEIIARISSDVRLGILSNIDPLNWDVALAIPLIRDTFPLAHCTLSFAERCRKPQPEIYRTAAQRLRVDPAGAVYLDDRPENVLAARQLGFRAEQYNCLVQPVRVMESILEKYGVLE